MTPAPEFSLKPKEIKKIADNAFSRFEEEIGAVLKVPAGARTFGNTVLAFERAMDRMTDACEIPNFLGIVSPDAAVRKASEDLRNKHGQKEVEVLCREDIFSALREYDEKKEKLAPLEARLLRKRLDDFRKSGLGLARKKRTEAKAYLKKLVSLSLKFQKYIRENKEFLTVSEDELKGLPGDFISGLAKSGAGKFNVPLEFSDFVTFMENARSNKARRRMYRKYNNICSATNPVLLDRALVLRSKLAKLLGYPSFADYVIRDRMGRNSRNVMAFLKRMKLPLQKKARGLIGEMRRLKGKDAGELKGWEAAYYANELKKQKLNLDFGKVREYFPVETVLKGMFGIFGELLGIKLVEADNPVWHESVSAYEIRELNGTLLAYFYLDLYQRPGKYKNGLCSLFSAPRELENGRYNIPAVAIIINLAVPAKGRPALLSFKDVEILFHEFGHVIQLALARPKYARLGPVNAAWDFVEIPSTLFQQWIYEPEVLARISGHYKDPGQKLPAAYIEGIVASKNLTASRYYLTLLARSMIDMKYHTAPGRLNTAKVYVELMKQTSMIGMDSGIAPQAAFGHMMPTYAAAYYSYVWAEVVAADLFSKFKSAGIKNKSLGREYLKYIVAPASSKDEAELIADFLGRPFNEKAFLKSVA